jgi:hypothetical protein
MTYDGESLHTKKDFQPSFISKRQEPPTTVNITVKKRERERDLERE